MQCLCPRLLVGGFGVPLCATAAVLGGVLAGEAIKAVSVCDGDGAGAVRLIVARARTSRTATCLCLTARAHSVRPAAQRHALTIPGTVDCLEGAAAPAMPSLARPVPAEIVLDD